MKNEVHIIKYSSIISLSRVFCFIFLTFLCCGININAGKFEPQVSSLSHPSSSREYGGREGDEFTHARIQKKGPITAIRIRAVWHFIVGLQICYGQRWSQYVGGPFGKLQEVPLFPGESITQIRGSYSSYLHKLELITDQGRQFSFGQDRGILFNAIPPKKDTVLRYVSGRSDYFIKAIRFHWDVKPGQREE
uniref:Jacalin-type lectin domain-containing protein n=1 Tax=Anolis carolinensis TaxID=28377 RepID=A0A803T7X8_ANOCA